MIDGSVANPDDGAQGSSGDNTLGQGGNSGDGGSNSGDADRSERDDASDQRQDQLSALQSAEQTDSNISSNQASSYDSNSAERSGLSESTSDSSAITSLPLASPGITQDSRGDPQPIAPSPDQTLQADSHGHKPDNRVDAQPQNQSGGSRPPE